MHTGLERSAERAIVLRRIWPPPSRVPPSMMMGELVVVVAVFSAAAARVAIFRGEERQERLIVRASVLSIQVMKRQLWRCCQWLSKLRIARPEIALVVLFKVGLQKL